MLFFIYCILIRYSVCYTIIHTYTGSISNSSILKFRTYKSLLCTYFSLILYRNSVKNYRWYHTVLLFGKCLNPFFSSSQSSEFELNVCICNMYVSKVHKRNILLLYHFVIFFGAAAQPLTLRYLYSPYLLFFCDSDSFLCFSFFAVHRN